ncbi:MAG: response regulator, partial [Deltaproteobacteria bacterium]|nr:response regulator [Deltaproteobacteria bacterium]
VAKPWGRILSCNQAFADILGFQSTQEATQADLMSLHPDPESFGSFIELLTDQRRLEYYETELRRRDGNPVYVVANFTGFFDERGRLIEIKGYLFDNTERKELEEQLRQSQKMEAVGRLAGGVAHDFNNLLTAITGYSALVLEGLEKDHPLRASVEEIMKAGQRASSLTGQLLAFSRRQVLQFRVLDLNEVVADMEDMLKRLVGEDIEFVTKPAPELGRVRVDLGQIQQVIMNLVINARDSMIQGGRLTIETANLKADQVDPPAGGSGSNGDWVVLSVSDTGQGMDPQTQAHIFEPFFTTKEMGKGTGLGLSTVYGIVQQSGGQVKVFSEPGQGATFQVLLPLIEDEAEPLIEPWTRPSAEPGSETVLLVEDEKSVRSLVREILEAKGHLVLEASDGSQALQVSLDHQGPIHLLVTDVIMPGMSGPQLAREIEVQHPDIRVLYISGYTQQGLASQDLSRAGTAFLHKPFRPSALSREVRRLLDGLA